MGPLSRLFDTSDFPPRWYCGSWTESLGWLHIGSDLGVWSAYFAIPAVLSFFVLRKRDLPFRRIFVLFVAFILLCGTTHLMEAIIFWWPAYRLAGVIKLLTAVTSWGTVVALIHVVPSALSMRNPKELENEIAARKVVENQLQLSNELLEKRVEERTAELAAVNASLQAEREWFRTTLASIGDAVITTDIDGQITTLNRQAENLTGWSSDNAAGKPLASIYNLVDEETREPIPNPARRALDGCDVAGHVHHSVLIARHGGESYIDETASPIVDAQETAIGCVLVFRDVSQRRKSEQALRESEEKLRFVLQTSRIGVWELDLQTQVATTSLTHDQCLGFHEPLTGWNLERFLATVHPEDRDWVYHKFTTAVENGTNWEFECRVLWPDQSIHWIEAHGSHYQDIRNRSSRFLGIIREVTERKVLEERLREIAARLSEEDRRKDEFLATLAHELRNPLAPIRTGLEVIKLAKNDPATIDRIRGTMERQTQQLITLVDDLLDISRITRSKLELRKCRVRLADVVQAAVEASMPVIDDANHTLLVNLPRTPVELEADPHRLAQVFSNLLNNAAKYTPDGGKIELRAEVEADNLVVTVKDNGIGIPIEMQDHIFEMFTQIDRPMEKGGTGLGIGLTLVRSLISMHNGQIKVISQGPGTGSEFRVSLPLPTVAHEPAPPTEPSPEIEVRPVQSKVLVVDDNQSAAHMLSLVVKMLGCQVQTAYDGKEAVQTAAEFLPDLILMDLGMPRMNGFEAAEYIRSQPWGQSMILVALTGWGQEEDKKRTRRAGFNHHLVKPADPNELQRLLLGQAASS